MSHPDRLNRSCFLVHEDGIVVLATSDYPVGFSEVYELTRLSASTLDKLVSNATGRSIDRLLENYAKKKCPQCRQWQTLSRFPKTPFGFASECCRSRSDRKTRRWSGRSTEPSDFEVHGMLVADTHIDAMADAAVPTHVGDDLDPQDWP